jgi:hypothetical protein
VLQPRRRTIGTTSAQKWIKTHLQNAPNRPPIKFNELKAEDFMLWVVSLKKKDGSKPGRSAYSTHRAALFNLFRDYKVRMSQELEIELANHYRGLKRTAASSAAAGNGEVKSGKSALEFSLYRFFGTQMLKNSTARQHEYIFSRLFMLLCWNLICRSVNVVKVCYSHIEWIEDSLCIYFAHQKCDQSGERPKDPRHIYANPVMPEICPALSLGIYLLCFPPTNSNVKQLFPGAAQYDHYRKVFTKFLNLPSVSSDWILEELKKKISELTQREKVLPRMLPVAPLLVPHLWPSIFELVGVWDLYRIAIYDMKKLEICMLVELFVDCLRTQLSSPFFLLISLNGITRDLL